MGGEGCDATSLRCVGVGVWGGGMRAVMGERESGAIQF